MVELWLGEGGEGEVFAGSRFPLFAHFLKVSTVVEGEFARQLHDEF